MTGWDPEQLWLKAKLFIDRANQMDHSDPEFPLWSALSLELLGRAALSRRHPVLNADRGSEDSVLYAFGVTVKNARSASAVVVFERLQALSALSPDQVTFCRWLMDRRNRELHTGELPFQSEGEASWLPQFYEVCAALCQDGKALRDFLGAELENLATSLIETRKESIRKRVLDLLSKHKAEAGDAAENAEAWRDHVAPPPSTAGRGYQRRACPACGRQGTMSGARLRERAPEYTEGTVQFVVEYQTDSFKCDACFLTLTGLSEALAAGLEPRFDVAVEGEPEPREFIEYGDM